MAITAPVQDLVQGHPGGHSPSRVTAGDGISVRVAGQGSPLRAVHDQTEYNVSQAAVNGLTLGEGATRSVRNGDSGPCPTADTLSDSATYGGASCRVRPGRRWWGCVVLGRESPEGLVAAEVVTRRGSR
jgi:hypothetical protein